MQHIFVDFYMSINLSFKFYLKSKPSKKKYIQIHHVPMRFDTLLVERIQHYVTVSGATPYPHTVVIIVMSSPITRDC